MYYERLFKKLAADRVKYLLVGGLAVNLHGVPRMTADIDIMIAFDELNVRALLALLDNLGYGPKPPVDPMLLADPGERATWRSDKNMRAFTFICPASPLEEVDIMLDAPFDFDEAYERREVVLAGTVGIDVASFDDLIATKRGSGRAQDTSDIVALELARRLGSGEED